VRAIAKQTIILQPL